MRAEPVEARSRERWVFKLGQELYGPVPAEVLEEKLRSGEIGPETLVAREQGPFAPIGAVEPFVRLAAELAAQRQSRALAQRRRRRLALGLAACAALFAVGGWIARAAIRSPLDRHELRALTIEALPMVVRAVAPQEEAEEIEWTPDAAQKRPSSTPPRPAPAAPTALREAPPPGDEIAVETRYDAAAIEGVVARNRARLLPCIRRQAESDPAFRGELPLTFVVGNDGRVARLWVERAGYRRGALHDCLFEEMRRWEFPTFEGQRPAIALRFRVDG